MKKPYRTLLCLAFLLTPTSLALAETPSQTTLKMKTVTLQIVSTNGYCFPYDLSRFQIKLDVSMVKSPLKGIPRFLSTKGINFGGIFPTFQMEGLSDNCGFYIDRRVVRVDKKPVQFKFMAFWTPLKNTVCDATYYQATIDLISPQGKLCQIHLKGNVQ